MSRLSLQNRDARIVALAVAYHLGRPGSETDPLTLQRHDAGLGPVAAALEPGLQYAQVEVELSPYQLHRLGEALLGLTNELKQWELSHGRSAVPGFATVAVELFPELSDASEANGAALDLVTHVVMLHRRLGQALREADADLAAQRAVEETRRRNEPAPWWKVWSR